MQRHRCCTMQSRPQLSREVCTSEGGKINQDKTPEKATRAARCSTPGQNTLFVHFCAENPSQGRLRRSKKYENVPVHVYQPIRSHVINRSTHGVKFQCGFKHTFKGPVCCGSAIVCPCCRRGRWSCARWSCPQYCVCWARIACQR